MTKTIIENKIVKLTPPYYRPNPDETITYYFYCDENDTTYTWTTNSMRARDVLYLSYPLRINETKIELTRAQRIWTYTNKDGVNIEQLSNVRFKILEDNDGV